MDTTKLLSEKEWNAMKASQNSLIVGEDPVLGSYLAFFHRYFGRQKYDAYENSYEMYRDWYFLENSPLGKALK